VAFLSMLKSNLTIDGKTLKLTKPAKNPSKLVKSEKAMH
jgi:hypothetical protein